MRYLTRLPNAQKKEYKICHQKNNEAATELAIKYPHLRTKSYSATHKPYDRTNYGDLSPSGRDGNEEQGDTELAWVCK